MTGAFTDGFTITKGATPHNQPLTSDLTAPPTGRTAAFDASASGDTDGSVVCYAWDFGTAPPGRASPFPTRTPWWVHTNVMLVVPDNGGLTGSLARQVTVTAPGQPASFVVDNFEEPGPRASARPISADPGRSAPPRASPWPVGRPGEHGRWHHQKRCPCWHHQDRLRPAHHPGPGQGSHRWCHYLDVHGRRLNTTNDYRVRVNTSGAVVLTVGALRGSSALTALSAAVTVPGRMYTPGQNLELRLQVTGTNPTTLRARVWPTGRAEPATWLVSATDTFAGLQVTGAAGLQPYLSSTATNAPIVVRMDNLVARATA